MYNVVSLWKTFNQRLATVGKKIKSQHEHPSVQEQPSEFARFQKLPYFFE